MKWCGRPTSSGRSRRSVSSDDDMKTSECDPSDYHYYEYFCYEECVVLKKRRKKEG